MRHGTGPRIALLAVAAVAVATLPACDDNPFEQRWTAMPDTALLYSLARPELNLNSAFDFVNRTARQVETPGASGRWDVVVDTDGSELVFLAPRALGIDSQAGVVRFEGMSFDEVTEAPADSADYSYEQGVPIRTGSTYAVRTREARGGFGRLCFFYAKLEPLQVSADVGSVQFLYDVNTVCDDRSLVPDEEG